MDRNQLIGFVLIFVMVIAYQQFFAPPPVQEVPADSLTVAKPTPQQVQEQEAPLPADWQTVTNVNSEPTVTTQDTAAVAVARPDSLNSPAVAPSLKEELITLENDKVVLTFNTKGAFVEKVVIKDFKTYDGEPLVLLTKNNQRWKLDLPITNGATLPAHQIIYQADKRNAGDTSGIMFTATSQSGQTVTHTYLLPAGSYELYHDLQTAGFANGMAGINWQIDVMRTEYDKPQMQNKTTLNFYSLSEGFDEISETATDDEEEVPENGINWFAFKQKFFNASLISLHGSDLFKDARFTSSIKKSQNDIKLLTAQASFPLEMVNGPGTDFKWYFGPNDFEQIAGIAPDFEKNVYMGWAVFSTINKYLIFPIFHFAESLTDSYGLVIFLLVLVVTTALFPLTYKSYVSMAKTKALKPEIDAIKAKHGDDMAKVQQEQMKLYGQVGINPVSGCIPLVLRTPFLLSMFYFFPGLIELRQESFLWANDLSTYDSILKLPFELPAYGDHVSLFTILMTVSTLVLTFFNNQMNAAAAQGPMKYITYFMPLIFMFVLNSYPAALSFYYLVSNLISIGQQAAIRQFVDEGQIRQKLEAAKIKNKDKKPGGFRASIEQAMKAQQEKQRQIKKK